MSYNLLNKKYEDGVFAINEINGFLPNKNPISKLPDEFMDLEILLNSMPINIGTSKGLLGTNSLASAVEQLPNYLENAKKITDPHLLIALYRDYTFLASAYLLEPSNTHYLKTGEFATCPARDSLPSNIAQPLVFIADKIGYHPYLDYVAYSLYNFQLKDASKGMDYTNLDMIRRFNGIHDEIGFIMLHNEINSHVPKIINGMKSVTKGISENNSVMIHQGLETIQSTMKIINMVRKKMWSASDPKKYNQFRSL